MSLQLNNLQSNWIAYLKRTTNYISHKTTALITTDQSWKREMPLFHFKSKEYLQQWKVGSDADIGGFSEAFWGLTQQNTALLWGNLSTEIPPKSKMRVSGYAGVRSLERPFTLFHRPTFDITQFRYISIRAKGDSHQWFVNIQSESMFPQYLWQHRLRFKTPGQWETIMLPVRDFVLTAHGNVMKKQVPMSRSKIQTIGFSILRQPGEFSLELDWVRAANTMTTFGDMTLIGKDEFTDDLGNVKSLAPGQVKEAPRKLEFFKVFPDNEKDKKWF